MSSYADYYSSPYSGQPYQPNQTGVTTGNTGLDTPATTPIGEEFLKWQRGEKSSYQPGTQRKRRPSPISYQPYDDRRLFGGGGSAIGPSQYPPGPQPPAQRPLMNMSRMDQVGFPGFENYQPRRPILSPYQTNRPIGPPYKSQQTPGPNAYQPYRPYSPTGMVY